MATPSWDSFELRRFCRVDDEGQITYHWPNDMSPEQWLRSFQEQYPGRKFHMLASSLRAVIVRN